MPLAREHELVAFGVHAHGKMRRFPRRIRRGFSEKLSSGSRYFAGALNNVRHLETEPRPCPLSLAPAVNADDRSGNFHFTDDVTLTNHPGLKRVTIEIYRSLHVLRPDDIFCALDLHGKKHYLSNLSHFDKFLRRTRNVKIPAITEFAIDASVAREQPA